MSCTHIMNKVSRFFACKLISLNPNYTAKGTMCKHGSTCIPVDDDYEYPTARQYRCDCSKTDGVEFYAGFECEYDATHYCITNDAANAGGVSFCTNGNCKTTWTPQGDQVAQ